VHGLSRTGFVAIRISGGICSTHPWVSPSALRAPGQPSAVQIRS